MAYRVAICDDSKTDAEYVKKILCQWAKDRGIEVYPDSDKIGIWGMGINKMFKLSDSADYYEGE